VGSVTTVTAMTVMTAVVLKSLLQKFRQKEETSEAASRSCKRFYLLRFLLFVVQRLWMSEIDDT
jgi:hypothetical protein